MKVLIGSRGTIGRTLLDQTEFDKHYNSDNIELMRGGHYDLVVCAAPSGSRLLINRDSKADIASVEQLESVLSTCTINKLILCSTVDAINAPNTPYGANRLRLEKFLSNNFDTSIFRLSSLIGKHIKKNCLYDMAHNVYIEKINPMLVIQWYPLDRLWQDIEANWNSKEINLVSEPIKTQEIADCFFDFVFPSYPESDYPDLQPYVVSREEIFTAIERYLK